MRSKPSTRAIAIGAIALLAVVAFFAFSGGNNAPPATAEADPTGTSDVAATPVEEVKNASPIKVGMSGGYKPYTYLNDDGELTGFDVDVWKEIGKRVDREVQFVTSDFSGLFGMLDVGQITTIANQITVTDARLEKYDFTVPYVYYGAQLLTHEDNMEIVDLETLKGKKVGVSLGSNYEEMVREFDVNGEIEVVTYDSGSGSTQDVAIGRIDAVFNDKLALLTTIKESGLPLKLSGEPIKDLQNAFPFVRNEENAALIKEVDAAIQGMYDDGTIEAISLKYFEIDITKK